VLGERGHRSIFSLKCLGLGRVPRSGKIDPRLCASQTNARPIVSLRGFNRGTKVSQEMLLSINCDYLTDQKDFFSDEVSRHAK